MIRVAAPAGSLTSLCQRVFGVRRLTCGILGLLAFAALWELGTMLLGLNPATRTFVTFGPIPTFKSVPFLWQTDRIQDAVVASGYRIGMGMLLAVIFGVPIGILMGLSKRFRELSNSGFQFLRMISPLSWMPLAVIMYPDWNQAIIFLIAIAAVWPVIFATAAGLAKVDPNWFKVARNLGANPVHMISLVILPAIAFDVFTGIRLALGVAWIVLVPAELLGVTSGLGYAIRDARDTLSYNHLTVMVLVIGIIGWFLDGICVALITRYSWRHRVAG